MDLLNDIFTDDKLHDDWILQEQADSHIKSKDDAEQIEDTAQDFIDSGRYSDLIAISGLFAGQYNMKWESVNELLGYTENFMTALDYDVATDHQLWKLVRQFRDAGKSVPVANQKLAEQIIAKSQQLHNQFPLNHYFNRKTFQPVNSREASRLMQYIHKIISEHGVTIAQFKEFHTEYHDYLNE